MKHKLFISIVLALFSVSAAAQYESAIATENAVIPYAVAQTLVRNYQDNYTFSVHNDAGTRIARSNYGKHYGQTPATPLFLELSKILTDYTINDLTFADDYAFFCGYYYHVDTTVSPFAITEEGVIGCFYVPDFYAGNTVSLTYHHYTGIYRFDKLVAYQDPASQPPYKYKVVALGRERRIQAGLSNDKNIIVEYDDFIGDVPSSQSPKQISDLFPVILLPKEIDHDLLLTGKHVIVVGYDFDNNWLCLRKAPRSNVLSSGALNTLYTYDNSNVEVLMMTHSTCLDDEDIVVSYIYQTPSETYKTRLRFFDTQTMDNTNSQEFDVLEKDEVIDLKYLPSAKTLVLLHPGITNPGTLLYDQFISIDPSATSAYNTTALYHVNPDRWYTSLDCFAGDGYVATGHNQWHYQHLLPSYSQQYSCYDYDAVSVTNIPDISTTKIIDLLNRVSFNRRVVTNLYLISLETYNIECEMQ